MGQLLVRGGDEAKGLALSVELPEALDLTKLAFLLLYLLDLLLLT